MSRSKTVIFPAACQVVTIKLGRQTVSNLRDLAVKESIKRLNNVTTNDLIKEALKQTYPGHINE